MQTKERFLVDRNGNALSINGTRARTKPINVFNGVHFKNEKIINSVEYGNFLANTISDGTGPLPIFQIQDYSEQQVTKLVNAGFTDLLSIPQLNAGNQLVSILGPNLTCSGGGNGSLFNRYGLLETELPADRPRFTFNPETGIYEGVYVEIEDQNKIIFSEQINGTEWINGGGVTVTPDFYDSPDGSQTADKIDISASGSQSSASVGTINTEGAYYVSCFVNFKVLSADRDFQLALYLVNTNIVQQLIDIDSSFINKWSYLSVNLPLNSGQSFDFVRFNGFGRGVGDTYSLWGIQLSNNPGSYIKTSGSAVTRPADIYTATGLINTANPYTIYKELNGDLIAEYFNSGNKTTYVNGVLGGTVAEAPSADLILSSAGSDKLKCVAVKEGTITENELIAITS